MVNSDVLKNSVAEKRKSHLMIDAPIKHKGISRIDHLKKRMHGWYVRVRLSHTTKSKFFNDNKHGGKEEALRRAVEWRDETEQQIGKPRTDNLIIGTSPRSKTGVTGVRRCNYKYVGKDGKLYLNPVYEVTWNANREIKGKTSVSITKYGEREAFRRACAIRCEKERKMYGAAVSGKWAANLDKLCAA